MDLPSLLLVMFGGALGSGARYAAEVFWPYDLMVDELPVATLAVNIIGSLIAGLVLGLSTIGGPLFEAQRITLFLATGLLGGFTTFSTFSTQTVGMLAEGEPFLAVVYMWATVTVCVLAAGFGYALGRAM
jgi:CrcB protein